MDYNPAEIRKLLQNALSEEEFTSLCYDYFRPVYEQFSAGMSRPQKIQRLLEYCERQGKFDDLLAQVRAINPGQVEKIIGSGGASTSPSAGGSAKDLSHIQSLLDIKQRRLNVLIEQKATMGPHTPAYITMEIQTLQAEINQHKIELGIAPAQAEPPAETPAVSSSSDTAIQPEREIFVSYAWGGDSEAIVNQLDQAFQEKGITIIRDKRDLGYRGSIKEFMEKIGRGKAVIVVISKKYLESENCMFELIQIAENDQFYDRIFPIVLGDANIYKPVQRIQYIKYWEDQIKELDEAIRSVGAANLEGIRDDIDLYTKIRATIAGLTNTLKDMNTLTPDMHRDANFEHLIGAVEQKMAE